MKNKHYIGFGTNKYPRLGNSSTLRMCESDVVNLGNALLKYNNFDISVFIGKDTTKQNIMLQIKNKIAELCGVFDIVGVKQYLLIARSSHGSQQPDINGDEADMADECWMCYDSAWSNSINMWNNVVIDDELCAVLNAADKSKIDIDVISDTCHSGTFTKNIIPKIILSRKFVFPRNYKQYKNKAKKKNLLQRMFNRFIYQYWIKTDTDWALFAGAEADSFSYETARGGALTSSIINYISSKIEKNKKDAAKIIIENVRRNMPKQHPHLECSSAVAKKPFLNT